ncbi:PAS domain S-box protein [Bacillus sp. FJAT-29953]|uniref:histidine kinase n=2 Tax=Bacillaceae TaxID=186817 RepID=A0A942YT71_9BACI|nr:PAS domain S-box protein [Neobacillus rhizophilus]MBU8916988.1 PAS domain S-box protein [Bacillus sp. FJAT-29953]
MMQSSITDIKKEKRILLEKHLNGSLNSYQSLFACDSDAIYAMDLDGYFIPLNPACALIFGYNSDEFSKLTYMKVMKLEHLDRAISFFYKAIDGKLQNFDCQIVHKSGKLIDLNMTNYPIVIDGEIVGVYAVAKDITEIKQKRKKLMEDIQQRENTYRDIVEHSPDAVAIVKDELILFANDTAVDLIGAKDKNEVIGKSIYDFLDSPYSDIVKQRAKKVENGMAVDFIVEKLVRMDGTIIEVEVKAIPAIYQNEPARHIIIRDIMEKKRTQKLLLQSEKLTVAGQLAAGIAHEIRNPLTAIKGFIKLMDTGREFNSSYLDIINSEVNRIELILGELLLLAKPQSMKFEKRDLPTILEHVKTLADTQAIMRNIGIHILYLTEIPEVYCDENQLKQMFINFLKNSVEAMPKGGEIIIEVQCTDSNQIKIRFIDQGCGIPKEHLERIGQPFFTTKDNGNGLGLMISMQIIENHNGTMHISSNENGTTMEILLPI